MPSLSNTKLFESSLIEVNYNLISERTEAHSYGMNGQENDAEVDGGFGNTYTAEFWEYDARIGRRWNIDPVEYADISPYATFKDNPIMLSDPNGDVVDFGKFGHGKWRNKIHAFIAKKTNKEFAKKFKGWEDSPDVYRLRNNSEFASHKLVDAPVCEGASDGSKKTHDVYYNHIGVWSKDEPKEHEKGPLNDPIGTKGRGLDPKSEFEGKYEITNFKEGILNINTWSHADKVEIISEGKTYIVTNEDMEGDYMRTDRKGPKTVNLEKLHNEGKIVGSEITIKITGNPKKQTVFDYFIHSSEGDIKGYSRPVDKKGKIIP